MDTLERQIIRGSRIQDVTSELCKKDGLWYVVGGGSGLFLQEYPLTGVCLEINVDNDYGEAIKIVQEGIEWRPVLSRII